MSNITSNASCNPSSISVSGKTSGSGTISWSLPTVPAGGVINSCKLTGTCTVSDTANKPATVTVNGTSVSSGVAFTINLGTGNTTSSVAVAATGPHKNTKSTITFSDLVYTVTYEEAITPKPTYTVTFKDWNGTTLKTQTVEEGTSATAPSNPSRDGYIFNGWDNDFSNVTSNLTVTAQYVEDTSSVVIPIQSVLFDKGSGLVTVEIPFDKASINYKLNYTWEPLNANKDFNITIDGLNANSIASYNKMTDEITFTGIGYITVTITSNQNPSISDSMTIVVTKGKEPEEPEEDVIEWTGIGTVATGLRAHDVEHNNYKINIDWDTQYFDIIVTEDFNYLFESMANVNIAYLGEVTIGSNTYQPTLFVNNNIDITIYGPMEEAPSYLIERNYPYTVRFAKEGIYVLYGSTSNLIMERNYDLDIIYFNEDGLDNDPISNTENGDYDVAFDLVVSERPNEEPEEPDLIEPVDGYIAKNLVSHGDWSYTFNVDWDTQYLDIEVLSYDSGIFGTCYYYDISNNSYDASYSHESLDDFIIHSVVVESDENDINIIRYSKVDGVCIITSNGTQIIPGNAFANDKETTIKAVIPTEWLQSQDGFMTFNIKITDIASSEEPEEDVIEWTGIGTVATGLNSGIKHSNYKINLDWDNEYFDIILQDYDLTSGIAEGNICNIRINNNTYNYIFSEGCICLEQNGDYIYECEPYVFPITLRFAKDGLYCLYEEENVKIGEIEYNNDDAIYILEDDQYNTDFNIDFDLVVSERPNEEPEEPDNNELIQGGINDETGSFEDETTNVVKTKYIDVSDKKQVIVNVLTDDVYIVKCYLYNANKELVKVLDISADKKRMFGLDLQKLIDEVMDNGNE